MKFIDYEIGGFASGPGSGKPFKIIPYLPFFESLLQDALHDEGLSENEMTFREHPTFIVANNDGLIGFFSFRMTHGIPHLNHYLTFRNWRRSWNGLKVFGAFLYVIVQMGHERFIAEIPNDKPYFRRMVVFWSGENKSFGKTEEGNECYLMPVLRKWGVAA
jgi:hypothetical protein